MLEYIVKFFADNNIAFNEGDLPKKKNKALVVVIPKYKAMILGIPDVITIRKTGKNKYIMEQSYES